MFTSDDENLWLIHFQSKKHIDFISSSTLGCKSSGFGQSSHITVKEKKKELGVRRSRVEMCLMEEGEEKQLPTQSIIM